MLSHRPAARLGLAGALAGTGCAASVASTGATAAAPRVQVQLTLAEPAGTGGRAAVVRHARRQDGHRLARRPAAALVQVVADRTVVDDEDRPGLMAVRGIGVVHQTGVEHFADPRHARCPRLDVTATRPFRVHVKSVQDPARPAGGR